MKQVSCHLIAINWSYILSPLPLPLISMYTNYSLKGFSSHVDLRTSWQSSHHDRAPYDDLVLTTHNDWHMSIILSVSSLLEVEEFGNLPLTMHAAGKSACTRCLYSCNITSAQGWILSMKIHANIGFSKVTVPWTYMFVQSWSELRCFKCNKLIPTTLPWLCH